MEVVILILICLIWGLFGLVKDDHNNTMLQTLILTGPLGVIAFIVVIFIVTLNEKVIPYFLNIKEIFYDNS